jgi:ribosomal-protein-alanine N-acetyltransferase
MNDFSFRKAEIKDITSIMEIEKNAFNLKICENETTFKERIECFSDGFFVLETNNKIVGYLSAEIWDYYEEINDEKFILGHSIKTSHNISGTELYISSTGILPDYRGKGLGGYIFQKSLENILKEYKKLKSIILIVSEKWNNAKTIYEKNGFTEIKIIKDFFNYNENGIVMRNFL